MRNRDALVISTVLHLWSSDPSRHSRRCLFIKKSKMGKKKSCQEVKVPRPLYAGETRLYGWVEEAVLTQPSVVESDSMPEFRRNFPLMEDSGA
ncbi:hypothetical protein PIB30_026645 [Stylosanthes scabra]|uniref:Uncharacterized protein n=1 Tax=Stylosanthes scabra TaxID=79078 RepID=A0ABU6YAR0_9FABA|nr:hypothetical protein [Stylosanthes scabra]